MPFEVLAHRGLWSRVDHQNSLAALLAAIEHGFGVETDIRDRDGQLVISHDPAGSESPCFRDFCRAYVAARATTTVALNIKSDGLADQLQSMLAEFGIDHWFVFDMSVPDAIQYATRSVPCFSRHSDVEPDVCLFDRCAGVWLDAFQSDWFDDRTVKNHLDAGKDVCVVSPELHGRSHVQVWQWLQQMPVPAERRLMLCTDFPEQFARGLTHDHDQGDHLRYGRCSGGRQAMALRSAESGAGVVRI